MKNLLFITFLGILFLFACDKDNEVDPASCDACALQPEVGPCDAAFPRYYYDADAGQCMEFIWGGCEGVVPFETLAECVSCGCNDACTGCALEPEVGPCDAAFPRYYYDADAGQCMEFIWGGCEGVVPFETLAECVSCGCH